MAILHALDTQTRSPQLPIVILHGLFGSADNWRSHIKYWAPVRRVIAFDLRNHGQSPHLLGMDYYTLAEDVSESLKQRHIDRFVLLGHSMGGKVALTLLSNAEILPSAAIIVDIAAVENPPVHQVVFRALHAVSEKQPTNRVAAEQILTSFIDDKATRLFLLTNWHLIDTHWQWRFALDNIELDYHKILAKPFFAKTYQHPTLLLKGQQSQYVDQKGIKATVKFCPTLTVIEIQQAGHWLQAEQPVLFHQFVDQFLQQIS